MVLLGIFETIQKWRARQRDIAELKSMSDLLLNDIGITRDQITTCVLGPAKTDPPATKTQTDRMICPTFPAGACGGPKFTAHS